MRYPLKTVQNVCKKISSGGTPARAKSEYYNNGHINWIKTQELNDDYIKETQEKITELGMANSAAKLFPENTVSIAMYGATIGKLGIMSVPCTTNQACCNMIVDETEMMHLFLFYSLLNKRNELIRKAIGAAQQNINVGIVEEVLITQPSLPIQNKIVHILESFSRKIRKNSECISILESQIVAIYRSWFNDYNYQNPTGKLVFNSQLERYVPNDWDVVPFKRFLTQTSEKIGDTTAPIYSTTNRGIALRDEKFNKNLTKTQGNNKKVVKDDLIFGLSREILNFGVFTDEIGSVSPAYQIFKIDQSVILPFMLELELRINMPQYMDILQLGAREGQGIRKDYLMNKYFLVPKMEVQEQFFTLYNVFQRKIAKLKEENAVLAEIRDTLLPRLMSGELPVEVGEE